MDDMNAGPSSARKQRLSLNIDLRWVVGLLVLAIAAMLALWQPWKDQVNANSRTIKVSGEAVVKAEPDEFVFSPTYTISDADREAALKAMTDRAAQLTAGLKAVGISDNQIKSNIDSYSREIIAYPEKPESITPSYSLQLTITTNQRAQAQKVQDYLTTTNPTGVITPYASFSTNKRKELESKARNEATKDARTKAGQSAANLGFKIGTVKSVNDGNGFDGGCGPSGLCFAEDRAASPSTSSSQLAVQPGENELRYSVSVEYYVK